MQKFSHLHNSTAISCSTFLPGVHTVRAQKATKCQFGSILSARDTSLDSKNSQKKQTAASAYAAAAVCIYSHSISAREYRIKPSAEGDYSPTASSSACSSSSSASS